MKKYGFSINALVAEFGCMWWWWWPLPPLPPTTPSCLLLMLLFLLISVFYYFFAILYCFLHYYYFFFLFFSFVLDWSDFFVLLRIVLCLRLHLLWPGMCAHNLMTNIIMNRMLIFFLLRRYTCATELLVAIEEAEEMAVVVPRLSSGIWFIRERKRAPYAITRMEREYNINLFLWPLSLQFLRQLISRCCCCWWTEPTMKASYLQITCTI